MKPRARDVDRAHVATLDVEKGCLACPQHPVHDAPHQRPRVSAPLYIRTCADGTLLAKVADPCPLAGHRDEPPAFANADVGSELDRPRAERSRLRKLYQGKHFGNVGFTKKRRLDK